MASNILPTVDEVKLKQAQQGTGFKLQPSQPSTGSKPQKFEQASHWLNVGVIRGGQKVPLPQGIPLSKLKSKSVPWNSTNLPFKHLRESMKDFWDQFKSYYETLQPGEEVDLVNSQEEGSWYISLRRVTVKEESQNDEDLEQNPLMTPLSFGKRETEPSGPETST
jgi:hypothetical protein